MFHSNWKLLLLLFLRLLIVSCTNDNYMVRDYFIHRKVSNVVAFSCGDIEKNIEFARIFNSVYVLASIWNFESVTGSQMYNFRKLLYGNYRTLGVYIDTRCGGQNYTLMFSEAAKYFMYDEMHKWLILGQNLNDTIKLLDDNTFNIDTDITIAVPSLTGYNLYDIYNQCKERGGSLNITDLGSWEENIGMIVTLKQSKFERRSNLHGMKLKVGILLSHTIHNLSAEDIMLDHSMKAKHGRSKFLFTLLSHMADLFNFTMELVEVNPKKREDNSAPIFVAFQKKIIDIAASPIAIKAEKLKAGDVIGPVWPMRSCFLFRTISSSNFKKEQFLRPLNSKVWYVILSTMVLAIAALVILFRLEGIYDLKDSCDICILITIGALCQQGSPFVPNHYPGRIAFLHVMLFSLLILNYYSASVVSNRLKNMGKKMNDSLISLANSHLTVAVEPTPYIRTFLQSTEEDVQYFYTKRWERIPESKRYLPLAEGLNRVSEGNLAYHTTVDAAYPYIERNFKGRMICELTEVHLFRAVLALWARHKSPFTPILKVGLIKMYNVGIRKRLLKQWSARRPTCPRNMLISEALSIQEATPVFLFLCISILLSLIICVIENLVNCLWPMRALLSIKNKEKYVQEDPSTKQISTTNEASSND